MGEDKIPVNIKVIHRYVIIDDKGNIVEEGSFESKSFVYNFIGVIRCALYGQCDMINRDTGYFDVKYLDDFCAEGKPIYADEDVDEYGLLVGSGTSDTTILSKDLDSKIGNDVLKHYKTEVYTQQYDTGTNKAWFTISRTFENVSTGTVTINEVGLFIKLGTSYYMVLRDTVAPKSLDPGWKIRWNIEIYVTT